MMRIKRVVWLCEDCLFAAVNDDYSGTTALTREAEEKRARDVKRGLRRLPHLVPHFDSEKEGEHRDECGVYDGGGKCCCCGVAWGWAKWHRFAVLTPASKRYEAAYCAVTAALSHMDGCALDSENDRRRVLNEIMNSLHAAKLA